MKLQGKIVFSSGRGTDYDIWCVNLENGELQQLTTGQDLNEFPRWSPDGKRVAFISTGDDLIRSLHVMNADGSGRKRLTDKVHCQYPSWSPDGKSIFFTANAADPNEIDICRYSFDAGKYEVVLRREGEESAPSCSPDGRKLIFAAPTDDKAAAFAHRDTEIWELDVASKSLTKLFNHPAKDFDPVYSPDGTKVAFISQRNERSEEEYSAKLAEIKGALDARDRKSVDKAISDLRKFEGDTDVYVANRDGSNLRKLTTNEGADLGVRWSPCGNYLVYSAAPKGEGGAERLRIVDVNNGSHMPFEYDREAFMSEVGAGPEKFLNDRLMWHLVPDFIERPFRMHFVGASFWGEEHHPDWTYAA